jgi:small subunit ribosomal protein S23
MKPFHKILRKLKVHPYDIHTQIYSKVAAKKINALPSWINAMKMYPMASLPLRSIVPNQSGAFVAADADMLMHKAQLDTAFSRNKKNPKAYVRTPPLIVYDEDRIREVFYRDHPFELDRPRIALEDLEKLNVKWTDIFGGASRIALSGERFYYN